MRKRILIGLLAVIALGLLGFAYLQYGWVFYRYHSAACKERGKAYAARQKGKHITGGLVNKQWVRARAKAGLPKNLVLYCARHDFGTYVLQKTGNIAVVMNAMGHSDVKTAMTYQHPELNVVREAINARQISGHVLGHRSEMTGRAN